MAAILNFALKNPLILKNPHQPRYHYRYTRDKRGKTPDKSIWQVLVLNNKEVKIFIIVLIYSPGENQELTRWQYQHL